jgi:RNA-directed DNA polymerase
LPIGNLTSQILANIYLNEFDRFVQHQLKPLGYVRYGDDFILWGKSKEIVSDFQERGEAFLLNKMGLSLHTVNHALQPTKQKLHFLGIEIWPQGHRLDKRMRSRITSRVNSKNIASYQALVQHHGHKKAQKLLMWEYLGRDFS